MEGLMKESDEEDQEARVFGPDESASISSYLNTKPT